MVSNITFTNGIVKDGDTAAIAATQYYWISQAAMITNLYKFIVGIPSKFNNEDVIFIPTPVNKAASDTINSNINQFIFVYKKMVN